MNTLIWIGIVLIAYTRPIDLYWRYTETVNGRIVKQRDYVKWICIIVAVVLIYLGVTS